VANRARRQDAWMLPPWPLAARYFADVAMTGMVAALHLRLYQKTEGLHFEEALSFQQGIDAQLVSRLERHLEPAPEAMPQGLNLKPPYFFFFLPAFFFISTLSFDLEDDRFFLPGIDTSFDSRRETRPQLMRLALITRSNAAKYIKPFFLNQEIATNF
jgi:hypothetical protein